MKSISITAAERVTSTKLARPTPVTSRDAVGAYLASIAKSSRRPMLESLRHVARLLGQPDRNAIERIAWHTITYPAFSAVVGKLRDSGLAPATSNRHIAAVRGVLRQCFLLGLLDADTWMRVKETKRIAGSRRMHGKALSESDVAALLNACDTTTMRGARDAAMLALLYGCGLRRDEAANALVRNYDPDEESLTIVGKRNKERVVFVRGAAKGALDHWLRTRAHVKLATILASTDSRGNLDAEPKSISGSALLHACVRIARSAGLKHFACHDLRRAFATHHFDRGVDIFMVQRAMGHDSSDTTGRYDMRKEREQKKIAGTVPFPVKLPKVPS